MPFNAKDMNKISAMLKKSGTANERNPNSYKVKLLSSDYLKREKIRSLKKTRLALLFSKQSPLVTTVSGEAFNFSRET